MTFTNIEIVLVDRAAKRNRYGGVSDQVVPENSLSVAQVLQPQQEAVAKQEQPDVGLNALMNYNVRQVTTINPIRDFTMMINNRDEDLVSDGKQLHRIFFF